MKQEIEYLISIILLALVLYLCVFILSACQQPTAPNMPSFKPKLWAADSHQAAIVRSQDKELIPANDVRFDDYVALTYSDLSCVYQSYVENCTQFKDPRPKCTEVPIEQIKSIINRH